MSWKRKEKENGQIRIMVLGGLEPRTLGLPTKATNHSRCIVVLIIKWLIINKYKKPYLKEFFKLVKLWA